MTKDSELQALQERAAEMVLSDSSLTGDLTDDEAKPVIAWAVAQAEVVAREVAGAEIRGGARSSAAPEPVEQLGDRLTPVRKLVRAVGALAADRHRLAAEEVTEEIDYVVELADRLPGAETRPRLVHSGSVPSAPDLAARQAGMDNREFVMAMLDLLPQVGAFPAGAAAGAARHGDAAGTVPAAVIPSEDEPAGGSAPGKRVDAPAHSVVARLRDLVADLDGKDDVTDDTTNRSDDDDAQEAQRRA